MATAPDVIIGVISPSVLSYMLFSTSANLNSLSPGGTTFAFILSPGLTGRESSMVLLLKKGL